MNKYMKNYQNKNFDFYHNKIEEVSRRGAKVGFYCK